MMEGGILNSPQVNDNRLVLIPKTQNSETVHHFCPISSCNTTKKVVSKILVNRWRPFLDDCFGPYQTRFLLGAED